MLSMKIICLFSLLLISTFIHASDCKVYGISEKTPQTLSCTFDKLKLALTCKDGDFYLDESKVSSAYHMEVEDGPTPLAFKTSDKLLTITVESKSSISAELEVSDKTLTGICQE